MTMRNGTGAVGGLNQVRVTTSWGGGNLPPQSSVYVFAGRQGGYRVYVSPQTMVQQWPLLPAHFPNTGLYHRQIIIPREPQPRYMVHLTTGFSPYNTQNIQVAHHPHAAPMPHQPQKSIDLLPQSWKTPARSRHFRKPVIAKPPMLQTPQAPQTPQIQKQSSTQNPKPSLKPPLQSVWQSTSQAWTRQAPSLHHRKPIVARTVHKATPSVQILPKKVVLPSPPPPPLSPLKITTDKTQEHNQSRTPKALKPEPAKRPEPVKANPSTRKPHSSLLDVINSKARVISRFQSERQKYCKKLAVHNRMVAKTINDFNRGDHDSGNQLMIKTNESFGALNQANKKMMEAQREALLASIDVDIVHNDNEDEPIPDSFLQFQQQVKDINALTADVDYYLRKNLRIPITPDGGFQRAWCKLGAHLIKVSKELGQ